MDGRVQALQEIVAKARAHGLTANEIVAALADGTASDGRNARGVLVTVLGYLGGTFIFAGVGVFVALQWDDMTAAARVVVTLGAGVTALILGLLAHQDERYEKAATPLIMMAGVLEPVGMMVAFDEFGSGGDARWAGLLTCGTMLLQFAAVFARLQRATPLLLTVVFAMLFWGTAFDLLDVHERITALVLGASLLFTAASIDRTPHRSITPPGYLVGGALLLYGAFDLVDDTPFEVLFLAAAAGLVYLSVTVHSRTLLGVATLSILAYTGYFTSEHFADSLGWPLALVLFGFAMIGLSTVALRIDRAYLRPAAPDR